MPPLRPLAAALSRRFSAFSISAEFECVSVQAAAQRFACKFDAAIILVRHWEGGAEELKSKA